ncbi:MAG: helix-turn-helix domain-containing protein [Solirubrobacterales bacterium]|nr:helix-turn-helix domain-containing protein [Solirubrobacterales bacterium]
MSHSTSLAIVSSAVAGDGLERVARSASEALGHPVAVICPAPGTPVLWPAEAVPAARLDELAAAAEAIVRLLGEGPDWEAMLLASLLSNPETGIAGQEETYRLLIGVMLRDPSELEQLRDSTIAPLLAYDGEHDTELLVTLETFLARHGSTTETAEAMQLHRHTVGYRLSRVQEVSGLSPYESDGRERLSLGLKAAQILAAWDRLSQPG